MNAEQQPAPSPWQPGVTPDEVMHRHGMIGKPVSRLDGPLKVAGKARFAAEVPYEHLAHAALVHSSIARGRISELKTEAARAAPGVILVLTYQNMPRLHNPPLFGTAPKAVGASTLPVMQNEHINWNGQPVALVLAETHEQAEYAASLIEVRYDVLPAKTDFDAAKRQARAPDTILGEPPAIEIGDAEANLKTAAFKVDATYRTPRYNHNAIELHAATVAWQGDELTVHDATQMLNGTAWTIAQLFGIDEKKNVRVLSPYVGGGFGGKALWIIRFWRSRQPDWRNDRCALC